MQLVSVLWVDDEWLCCKGKPKGIGEFQGLEAGHSRSWGLRLR